MLKKIVIVTTGQPSCNPRVVKEADALVDIGFDVTVLYCYFIQWAYEKDIELLKNVKWKYELVGGSPFYKKKIYNFTRLRFKISTILNRFLGNNFYFAEMSQARAFFELLNAAKKIKADWYIGHNLGALAVATKAASFNNSKAGFDFEDYHRSEIKNLNIKLFKRTVFLENKYIPLLSYYSTSSDLITDITKKNHSKFSGKVLTLLNCFQLKQQPHLLQKVINDKTLQLFWFSQTVGKDRGLELLISAFKKINNLNIHLTLAGRCDQTMFDFIKATAGNIISNIHFSGIIAPEELPNFASKFHVGLALETGFSINNDIALSNKIFTYLLSGNAIISSETAMQLNFNQKYKVGKSFKVNDLDGLIDDIIYYYDNMETLNKQKEYNYTLAQKELNWDNESKKLLEVLS